MSEEEQEEIYDVATYGIGYQSICKDFNDYKNDYTNIKSLITLKIAGTRVYGGNFTHNLELLPRNETFSFLGRNKGNVKWELVSIIYDTHVPSKLELRYDSYSVVYEFSDKERVTEIMDELRRLEKWLLK